MAAELERDARLAQPLLVVDALARVGERDRRAAADEQLRRRDAAARRADDDDPLARDGEGAGRHRSFSVVRLKSAKMIARMTNRVITFGSLQPISSKWWWSGAILKTRLPGELERADLDDDRQRLEHEHAADDHEEELLLDEQRDRAERAAERRASRRRP